MPRPVPKKNVRAAEFLADFAFPETEWKKIRSKLPQESDILRAELEQIGNLYLEDKWTRSVTPTDPECRLMIKRGAESSAKFKTFLQEIDSKSEQLINAQLFRQEKDPSGFCRELKRLIFLYNRAAQHALSEYNPAHKKEASLDEDLAVRVGKALMAHGVKLTLYNDGLWARILRTILKHTDRKVSNVRHLLSRARASMR